ncbi:50S ribosomal protein L4 [Candidatus Karelsulcia muelleri]|uniref:50S ribosomal protein L4 n=1 Tax=Candidatus Karelsulcia muelleri TaxID=336810 RepID=UPI001952726F|nr:50S ribosomal protein L4 [Candidatus Karelsulcia muelleri]
MVIEIFNKNGLKTGRKIKWNYNLLDNNINIKTKNHLIYLEIKRFLAAQRQGSHKTKGRSQIQGSNKKIQKQKGSGNARKGDIKNPLFVGGGRIFGPVKRKYNLKLNKKIKKIAIKILLYEKIIQKKIKIIEPFILKEISSKKLKKILNKLNILKQKTLIISNKRDKNLYFSSRNFQNVKIINIRNGINSYDIAKAYYLIIKENAIKYLENMLNKR